MKHIFNIHGVDYNFDENNNSMINNYHWFINLFSKGLWENNTFSTFNAVKNINKTAIDLGGWIGPTAIWLSKNFKNVTVVEADKVALSALKKNLQTSGCNNICLIEKPVYSVTGKKIYFGNNNFRESSLGDSMSQLREKATSESDLLLETISLHDIIMLSGGYDQVSFIKLDIEGGEENIIPDLFTICSENKYDLWMSFHYDWWADKNIERFNKYFSLSKNHKDISSIIRKYPFGSLQIKF